MVIDWYIEAYREDTEELAWELLLVDVEAADLEKALNISLVDPGMLPFTPEQVITAIQASSSDVSPDDLDLDAERLSFFLSATRRD
jgi:hypothetical protein